MENNTAGKIDMINELFKTGLINQKELIYFILGDYSSLTNLEKEQLDIKFMGWREK